MASSDEQPSSPFEGYQLDSILRITPLKQDSPSSSSSDSSEPSSIEEYCYDSILRIVPPSQNKSGSSSSPHELSDPKSKRKRPRSTSPSKTLSISDDSRSSSDLSSIPSESPTSELFPNSTDEVDCQPNSSPRCNSNKDPSPQREQISASSLHLSYVSSHGFCRELGYAVVRVKPSGVALHGTCWLSVISGAVQVVGAILFPSSSPILFQSPFRPLLVLPFEEGDLVSNIGKKESIDLASDGHPDSADHVATRLEMREAFLKLEADEALILVTEVNRTSSGPPLCPDLPHTHVQYGISELSSIYTEPINFLKIYEDSKGFAVGVPKFVKAHGLPARLLIVGAHNAGKSTLARAIVNYHITFGRGDCSRASCVYIDVDVGLPDRSVSGVIAAHVVTEPSISRQTACRSVPLAARFFADVTPRENPSLYAQCVQAVINEARIHADVNGLPMVVNSHGWTTGAGEALIANLCAQVDPTVMVRVRGGTSPRTASLADIALDRVLSTAPSRTHIIDVFGRSPDLPIDRTLPNASQERDRITCAYFAQEIATGRTRRVRVRDLRIVISGGSDDVEVLNHNIPPQALISTTVALARAAVPHETFEGISAESETSSHDPFSASHLDVRGLAVVRGVDDTGEWLFVATPLPTAILQACSVIIVGFGIQTPFVLITGSGLTFRDRNQDDSKLVPFCMRGGIDTGCGVRNRKSIIKEGVRYR